MTVGDTRTLTNLLELLSHPRRRFVLHSLQGSRDRLDVGALAISIATWEAPDTVSGPTELAIDAVTVSLHHTHFPRLAEAGLVTYDVATESVETVEAGEQTVADLFLDDELRLERESMLKHTL